MKLIGTIDRISYYNSNNGYTIASLKIKQENFIKLKKEGNLITNRITIIGAFDRMVLIDEEYTLEGEFVKDPTYGLQFKFSSFNRTKLQSLEGIVNYLSSDLFPGIGLKTAKKIVDEYGMDTIDILLSRRDALKGLGINQKNQDIIFEVTRDNQTTQETVLFFLNYGLTIDLCHKIIKALGSEAIEKVKENPYILMNKLDYYGFIKNDAFAAKMGVKKDDLRRIEAAIFYILKENIYNTGHSFIELPRLKEALFKFIEAETTDAHFSNAIATLVASKKIFIDQNNHVFDYYLYNCEKDLAHLIVDKLSNEQLVTSFSQTNIENAYKAIAKNSSIFLNPEQEKATKSVFSNPLAIITGGPGTGKSTIVNYILKMYKHLVGNNQAIENIALLAPTGRAAKRLKEITALNAATIHKYLGYNGENNFEKNKNNKTTEQLIIIDEASMMDLPLSYQLFSSLSESARIIIVGDVNQLPSVGPGQILKDLIDTREIKTLFLTKIHRQAENSKIINLAHDANEGFLSDNILENFTDRLFIDETPDTLIPTIVDKIKQLLKENLDITKDIQILAPMYRCPNGINDLNNAVQQAINPRSHLHEIKIHGQVFRLNDKVIQLVNRSDKGIMNGDIGVIKNFTYKEKEISGVTVRYDLGNVDYTISEMEDLKLAYAISVHKAQGSEFDYVIMPLMPSYQFMFKRKLIYTAMTRAKKCLILVGDINSLKRGITYLEYNRHTILKEQICQLINQPVALKEILSGQKKDETPDASLLSPYDFLKKDTVKNETKHINPSPFDNLETSSDVDYFETNLDDD